MPQPRALHHKQPSPLRATLALAVGAVALGGCATQSQVAGLQTTTRALEERNVALQQELKAKETMVSQLQDRVASSEQTIRQLRSRNGELNADLLNLREEYRRLTEQLANVGAAPLDPLTDQALRDFAARNPNLVQYDPARGMLRLSSDLTFSLGSADLSESARESIRKLATLLNNPQAQRYDIRIVGHTDNVPISASRNRFPTNMHLSAARAISVHQALKQEGVDPRRMEIAGWGPYRPVAPNPPKGGAKANRRVEIYLVPRPTGIADVPLNSQEPAEATSRPSPTDPIK